MSPSLKCSLTGDQSAMATAGRQNGNGVIFAPVWLITWPAPLPEWQMYGNLLCWRLEMLMRMSAREIVTFGMGRSAYHLSLSLSPSQEELPSHKDKS